MRLLLCALAVLAPAAVRGRSLGTFFNIVNTGPDPVRLIVSDVNNYDWDGDSRPDKVLQGQVVQPYKGPLKYPDARNPLALEAFTVNHGACQRLEINYNSYPVFTLEVQNAAGQTLLKQRMEYDTVVRQKIMFDTQGMAAYWVEGSCPPEPECIVKQVEVIAVETEGPAKLVGQAQQGSVTAMIDSTNDSPVVQSVTMSGEFTNSRTITSSWSDSVADEWKKSAGLKLLGIDLGEEYGKTHTKAEGGSTEDSQTVTITNSVTSAVPAYSNCSATVQMNTLSLTFQQDVWVTISKTCGAPNDRVKTQQVISVGGALQKSQSSMVTHFDKCIPLEKPDVNPVPTAECSTNPVCRDIFPDGNCCPTKAGIYLGCCAQAIAHPECKPTDFRAPEDAICPSRKNVFSECCTNKEQTQAQLSADKSIFMRSQLVGLGNRRMGSPSPQPVQPDSPSPQPVQPDSPSPQPEQAISQQP